MNEARVKEYIKIGAIATGIALSSGALVSQNSSETSTDVRINAIEQNIAYMQAWRDKADNRIETTTNNVNTLNVQLAQVLVKMDNIIENLKELKK